MSVGLEQVREEMARYLREKGVRARTAWPPERPRELERPEVLVSLRGCRMGPGGFQDYLGERYNPETGRWEERFGRRAELTLGLDLYVPLRLGGEGMQSALDALAGALLEGGPEGLNVQEFSCGETGWDESGRLLRRGVQAVCGCWVCAWGETDGVFLDFELRGGLQA